jgi:hypothetical protein
VPEGSPVTVTLVGPDGTEQLREEILVDAFFAKNTLILESDRAFNPGQYELTISGQSKTGPEKVIYRFDIRLVER